MKVRRVACALGLALATVAASPAVASADTSPPPTYYLPLGDSLAAGYQPGGQGDTNQGYANQLFTTLTSGSNNPGLQLQKLGCSGETTTTMLNGGICTYPGTGANSQVEAAVQFLAAHPGRVKYVTIDIGANDVQKCAKGVAPSTSPAPSRELPRWRRTCRRYSPDLRQQAWPPTTH